MSNVWKLFYLIAFTAVTAEKKKHFKIIYDAFMPSTLRVMRGGDTINLRQNVT